MTFGLNTKAPLTQGLTRGGSDHENYNPRDRRSHNRTAMMI